MTKGRGQPLPTKLMGVKMQPTLPEHFVKALANLDSRLTCEWEGDHWVIYRRGNNTGIKHRILDLEKEGRYVEPSWWVIDALKMADLWHYNGTTGKWLAEIDQRNDELRERRERRCREDVTEAAKDAWHSGVKRELEAL